MIAPKLEQMDKDMDNVVFLKVDVDEAEDVAQEYNISAMPTFVFLKNGQKVWKSPLGSCIRGVSKIPLTNLDPWWVGGQSPCKIVN